MDINSYIDTELYIIVPVLYIIGTMIKKSDIADKWIPLLLGVIGITLATVYKFTVYVPSGTVETLKILYTGITQGILCASGSVYANNIVKQMRKDETKDKDEDADSGDS